MDYGLCLLWRGGSWSRDLWPWGLACDYVRLFTILRPRAYAAPIEDEL